MEALMGRKWFDAVGELGGVSGVLYSLENTRAYMDSSIVFFLNVLENCRYHGVSGLR